jgi:hypothetical protein
VPETLEELRTQAQHQPAIRQPGIPRPPAAKIMNRFLEITPESINYAGKGGGPAFQRELEYLKSTLPTEQFASTQHKKNSIRRVLFASELIFNALPLLPRLRVFIKKMSKNKHLSSAILEKYTLFLCEFLCYQFIITKKKKRPRGVVTHALFSPRSLALISAAIKEQIPSVLILHGACSTRFPEITFPTFPVDLFLIKSQASVEGLGLKIPPKSKLFFYGLPGIAVRLRPIPDQITTLGICLTHAVIPDKLDKAISEIQSTLNPNHINLRFHPRDPLSKTYQKKAIHLSSVEDSVQDFAKQCDLVIVGNTSAVLEILKIGCPVILLPTLDTLGYDVFGFAAKKLIPAYRSIQEISISDARTTYSQPDWEHKMEYFDPSYTKNRAKVDESAKHQILELLDR